MSAGSLLLFVQAGEERINDLENTVEVLDQRVDALETQIARLPGADEDLGASDRPSESPDASSAVAAATGTGTMVSEKFALEPGRYRVSATLENITQFSGFIVYLHDPSGYKDNLFNESIETSGTWEGSVVVAVSEDGEYFVDVSNTDESWTLEFEQF